MHTVLLFSLLLIHSINSKCTLKVEKTKFKIDMKRLPKARKRINESKPKLYLRFKHDNKDTLDYKKLKGMMPRILQFKADTIPSFLRANNWFDVKDCYYDDNQKYEGYLKKLAKFRQNLVRHYLGHNFCNKLEPTWYDIKQEDPYLKKIEDYGKFLTGTVWLCKCKGKEKEKGEINLILNSFGSNAPTSDFDFSLFIFKDDEKYVLDNFKAKKIKQEFDGHAYIKSVKVDDYKSKEDEEKNLIQNMMLATKKIMQFEEDARGFFVNTGSLGDKLDSNAYPDIMILNDKVLKYENDKDKTVKELAEQKQKLARRKKYYAAVAISTCRTAYEVLLNEDKILKIPHLDTVLEECEEMMRIKTGIKDDKTANKFISTYNTKYTQMKKKKFDLYGCIDTGLNWKKLEINMFKLMLQICHLNVDEAYLTLGALEHYKFGKKQDKEFYCHSLLEAFVENFAMMIKHVNELIHEDKELDSRPVSDKFTKYFLRAFKALEHPGCIDFNKTEIKEPLFVPEEFLHWFKDFKDLKESQLIYQNLSGPSNFHFNVKHVTNYVFKSGNLAKKKMKSYLKTNEKAFNFSTDDFAHNIAAFSQFIKFPKMVRQVDEHHKIEHVDYEYKDDAMKKVLYYKHFKKNLLDNMNGVETIGQFVINLQYFFQTVALYVFKKYGEVNIVEYN